MRHGHWTHGRQECPGQRPAEAVVFVQGKESAVGVRGIEQSAVMVFRPGERDLAPGAFREHNRLALELPDRNIVAPEVRGAVLSEDATFRTHGKTPAARDHTDGLNAPSFYINGEQVPAGGAAPDRRVGKEGRSRWSAYH